MGWSGRAGRGLWLAVGLILVGASGCGPAAVAGQPDAATPTASSTAATLPPTPVATAPQGMAAVATAPATTTPEPTGAATIAAPPSPTPQPTAGATRDRAEAATPTPTLFPTFTPPPPPPRVAEEHLYWQRPVPATGPTWTDKSYPYGSTRGGMLRPHHGVEFVVPSGTPVLAVAAGTVRVAGDDSQIPFGPQTAFYGNLVVLEVAGTGHTPVFALYGHLSEVSVAVGQIVAAGDVLGLSGASGVADGPHLHLEVRVGENSYDATRNPLLWLAPLPGTGVVAGRVVGASGELLHEAPVALQRIDGRAPYTATTSYALSGPNADGVLGENFVMDDVEPGFHQVIVTAGSRRHTVDLWVYPDRINWIEIAVTP